MIPTSSEIRAPKTTREKMSRPVESVPDERRQIAAVVDMRVGEHHGINGSCTEGQVAVAMLGILAAALVEPAIEQVALAIDLQVVHGPGDRSGRAPECNFH